MGTLIIDDTLRGKFSECSQPVILCDSRGNVLGCFIPTADASQYEPVTPRTPEELDRIMAHSPMDVSIVMC